MRKKNEKKVSLGVAPTLKSMLVGDIVTFPLAQMNTVKYTASNIKLLDRKIFKTKQLNNQGLIQVTRTF